MTQNEWNASLDRQVKSIHSCAHRVLNSRERMTSALQVMSAPQPATDAGSITALGIAAMVTMLLVMDAAVAGPALSHRFATFGLPVEAAWVVAMGASVLLMFLEMVVAVFWFRAYERSLVSRRYAAVVGWSVGALIVFGGPLMLSISQLLAITGGDLDDQASLAKEIGLVLLFGGAHAALISSGRYLESAKTQAFHFIQQSVARIRHSASQREAQAAHNRLSDEYRVHARSVKRAVDEGFCAELGPFEDQTLELIRDRHKSVDESLLQFGNRPSKTQGGKGRAA